MAGPDRRSDDAKERAERILNPTRLPKKDDDSALYNRRKKEDRCDYYVPMAHAYCTKYPNSRICAEHLEIVQDCPKEEIEGLPPQRPDYKSTLDPPFVRREVINCRILKKTLDECLEKNSNFDAQWRCAPFKGLIDACIASLSGEIKWPADESVSGEKEYSFTRQISREQAKARAKRILNPNLRHHNFAYFYNHYGTETRCDEYVPQAHAHCTENPNSHLCQEFLELVQRCPKGALEGLPPRKPDYKSTLDPPFVPKEVQSCRNLKKALDECRQKNNNFDALWRCAPYKGYVDACIADKWL